MANKENWEIMYENEPKVEQEVKQEVEPGSALKWHPDLDEWQIDNLEKQGKHPGEDKYKLFLHLLDMAPKISNIHIDAATSKMIYDYEIGGEKETIEKNLSYTDEDYEKSLSAMKKTFELLGYNMDESSKEAESTYPKADPNIILALYEIGDINSFLNYFNNVNCKRQGDTTFDLKYNIKDIDQSELSKNEKKKMNEIIKFIKPIIGKECIEKDGLMTSVFNKIKSKLFGKKEKLLDGNHDNKDKDGDNFRRSEFLKEYGGFDIDYGDILVEKSENDEKTPEKTSKEDEIQL